MFGARAGVLAALLLALNGTHVLVSQEARSFAWLALWVWLAVNDEADAISALPLAVPVLCLLAAPALAVGLLLAKRSAAAGTDQPSA